jgi:hypothetical protein
MALNDAAADQALDDWVDNMSPAPADATAMKAAMRPLVRAIFNRIRINAVVKINMPPDGDGHLE